MSLVSNRSALRDFEIIEKYEAGLVLKGSEVRSLRLGHGRLDGSYASVSDSGIVLKKMWITPYQPNNSSAFFEPERNRNLLFSKKELVEIQNKIKASRLTLVPLSVYNKGRFIKVELGIARGKKKQDKRESIKKRDASRDLERTLKTKYR